MIFRRRAAPLTDEEFVECIRQQVAGVRRQRRVLVILYGLAAIVMIAVAFYIVEFLGIGLVDGRAYGLGLFIGAVLGFKCIMAFSHFASSLSSMSDSSFRMHRLLLKYHGLAAKAPGGETDPR
jgi:hypothetical protein